MKHVSIEENDFNVTLAATELNIKLVKQNSSFFEIGGDILEVRQNRSVDEFRKFLNLINLERTSASRYMECANSDRLKECREQLSHITCWTTINKIRVLSDDDFEYFKTKHLSGDKPTKIRGADVDACSSAVRNKPLAQVIQMQPITISPKQSEFSQDVLDQLLEQMGQINNLPGVTLRLPTNIKSEIDRIIDTPDDVLESTVYDAANDNPWVGMPDFENEEKTEDRKIIVRFKTDEAFQDFQERLEQPMTGKTKSTYHPKDDSDNNKEERAA